MSFAASYSTSDTIAAVATAPGTGAIAVIRISGKEALNICTKIFTAPNGNRTDFSTAERHSVHFGNIISGSRKIDEVLVSAFIAPKSYTGEHVIEISCHGSTYIQQEIMNLIITEGARQARPGEFTLRAFLNKKLDLSQAEAVADLVSSTSETAHQLALKQMRGGYSSKISKLKVEFIHFASLLELELDFSEEDVEFANREQLSKAVKNLLGEINFLKESFALGNVIKNGIPVTIAGKPNAGKSTLLNTLLNDERAIVSEIPGTTRDYIEDELIIKGMKFRLTDTAGIRHTLDEIESIGVGKAYEKMGTSAVIIYLFDIREISRRELSEIKKDLEERFGEPSPGLIFAANKIDTTDVSYAKNEFEGFGNLVFLSAREHLNIDALRDLLLEISNPEGRKGYDVVVTNSRHFEALSRSASSLEAVMKGIEHKLTTDLIALEVRNAIHSLSEITGEIASDDLLQNIFSRFCIGK